MLPNYLKENVKKVSLKREKKLDKDIRIQVGSGSFWGAKGDERTKDCLIEEKGTRKGQIIIKESWLKKVFIEALKDSRTPILILDFKEFRLVGRVERR